VQLRGRVLQRHSSPGTALSRPDEQLYGVTIGHDVVSVGRDHADDGVLAPSAIAHFSDSPADPSASSAERS